MIISMFQIAPRVPQKNGTLHAGRAVFIYKIVIHAKCLNWRSKLLNNAVVVNYFYNRFPIPLNAPAGLVAG